MKLYVRGGDSGTLYRLDKLKRISKPLLREIKKMNVGDAIVLPNDEYEEFIKSFPKKDRYQEVTYVLDGNLPVIKIHNEDYDAKRKIREAEQQLLEKSKKK